MDTGDQTPTSDERKMAELRRLLRRLDRTDTGPAVAVADEVSKRRHVRFGGGSMPLQPPPLPPLPPRWPAEDATIHTEKAHPTSNQWRVPLPYLAVGSSTAAGAVLGLILWAGDVPRPGASPPSSPSSTGPLATTNAVPETPKSTSHEPAARSVVLSTPDATSVNPAALPALSKTVQPVAVVAEPPPKLPERVEVKAEVRTAALDTAPLPVTPKASPPATPALSIPPSFMIEAGVTAPFPLRLARDAKPANGGYLIVSGLIRGSRFSSGTEIVFDTWQIPVDAVGGLKLNIPSDGEADLEIELRGTQGQTLARTTTTVQAVKPASTSRR